MDYFKHDLDASGDDKICELLASGGYEMLGYYWRFVEYLYNRGGRIEKSKLRSVCWSLHMDIDKLTELLTNYDLFCENDEEFYSERIVNEVEHFEAVKQQMSEIGKAGGRASAKARAKANGQANGQVDAKAHGEPYGQADGQADGQQNKINKINKINKYNKGVALSGEKAGDELSEYINSQYENF